MLDLKGLVKMYAPNGAEVFLPFDPARTQQLLAEYERQGLSPVPLSEYERERRSQVGAFVVRPHINPDGSETPVVDVYFRYRNGWMDRLRSMRVYLNTEQDIARFEAAFGVSLQSLAFYENDTPIDRSKVRPGQEKFIHRPSCPVWVVWRLNPASESDEQAPKRLFVRWERDAHCKQQSRQQPQGDSQHKQGNGLQGSSQGRRQQRPASRPQQETQAGAQRQEPKSPSPQEVPQPQAQNGSGQQAQANGQSQSGEEKRYHFSQWPVLAAIAREWQMPAGEVAKYLFATLGKTGKRWTVAEALEWAKANRPQTQAA